MLYHGRNSNKRFLRIQTQKGGFRANSLQSRNPTSTDRSRRPFETPNQREIKSTVPVSSAGSYSYDGQCATMRGPLKETMRKEREGREKKKTKRRTIHEDARVDHTSDTKCFAAGEIIDHTSRYHRLSR